METKFAHILSSIHELWSFVRALGQELRELKKEVSLLKNQQNGKGNQTNSGDPLKEWISIVYEKEFGDEAKVNAKRGSWKALILPYISAYLAGLEEEMTRKEFEQRFGINVEKNAYSNWTKNYFRSYGTKTPIDRKYLYTSEKLVFWWKKLGISFEEYSVILENLHERGLL